MIGESYIGLQKPTSGVRMSEIACVCRRIYEDEYDTEEELIERLKKDDARCRQCLLRYEDPYDDWKPERTI